MNRFTIWIIAIITLLAVLVGAIFVSTPQVAPESDVATLERANQLYNNEQFNEAAILYEQLIAQGIESSVIFYNLGNTQMQLGEVENAIGSYQKALALDPRDPDIRNNLEFAYNEAGIAIPEDSIATFSQILTPNEWLLLILALWTAVAIIIIAIRHGIRPGIMKPALALAIIGLVVAGVLLLGQLQSNTQLNNASSTTEFTTGNSLPEPPL